MPKADCSIKLTNDLSMNGFVFWASVSARTRCLCAPVANDMADTSDEGLTVCHADRSGEPAFCAVRIPI